VILKVLSMEWAREPVVFMFFAHILENLEGRFYIGHSDDLKNDWSAIIGRIKPEVNPVAASIRQINSGSIAGIND
jgi:hypothetical protein